MKVTNNVDPGNLSVRHTEAVDMEQISWGGIEGQEVYLYTLSNASGSKMSVTNFGATIQSLYIKDRDGNRGDVVLGYDSLAAYVDDPYYVGCIVGRYANRIAGGTIKVDGSVYNIHTRDGGYHLHGGNAGFNKKVWSAKSMRKEDACGIRLSYLSTDGEEGFPGNLKVDVTYWLTDADQLIVEYSAFTDKTTIINLTQHSYFNLAGHDAGNILDHEMLIPTSWYLPVNDLQVPTGDIASVEGTSFDFSNSKKIGLHIDNTEIQLQRSNGYDHSWVLEEKHTPVLKHAATVRDKISGRVLDVYTTEPAVHFYSSNFIIPGTKGKRGLMYDRRSAFCLETQHFPDAPNNPHFPTTVLNANEEFYSKTVFEFSVE